MKWEVVRKRKILLSLHQILSKNENIIWWGGPVLHTKMCADIHNALPKSILRIIGKQPVHPHENKLDIDTLLADDRFRSTSLAELFLESWLNTATLSSDEAAHPSLSKVESSTKHILKFGHQVPSSTSFACKILKIDEKSNFVLRCAKPEQIYSKPKRIYRHLVGRMSNKERKETRREQVSNVLASIKPNARYHLSNIFICFECQHLLSMSFSAEPACTAALSRKEAEIFIQ